MKADDENTRGDSITHNKNPGPSVSSAGDVTMFTNR